MINGALIVNKTINTEFEDSTLIVNGNLTTQYFHGIDIWANMQGNIDIDYGWGHCNNKENKAVFPKNDLETSLLFLNCNRECDSEKINGLIKQQQ